MAVKVEHTRTPGFLERQYICRNTNKYWTNINIISKCNGRITPSILKSALRQLCLKHTILVTNFFRTFGEMSDDGLANGTNFEVRPVSSISFKEVVSFVRIPELSSSILETVNGLVTPMNMDSPLWRVIVYEDSSGVQYLCIYFDHSIFDGLASIEFHKLLISEMNKASPSVESGDSLFHYERDIDFVKIPTSVEDTGLFGVGYFYRASLYVRRWWDYFYPPEKVFSYNEVTRDISSKYRMIKFPPEKVKEILSHCKRNGFTMTPLLTIIALKAFEDTVGVNLEHLTLSCIPVNGRPMAPGYNNSNPFGVYIGFDFYKFPKICNNITSFTKSLYKQLNQSIRSNIPFQVVGMYRYANIWDIYKLKLGRPEGRATLVVSNLGRIQTNPSQAQSSQFSIEDIWFSSCLGLVTHFLLNGITAPNGDLNIIFGTLPEYEEYFDDFISMFELIIEEEVGKGNNQLIE